MHKPAKINSLHFFRDSIVFVLLSLVIFHGELYLVVFKMYEYKYKKEAKQIIKSGLAESELLKFTFHKSIKNIPVKSFKWVEPGEFKYNDEMYDIVKEKETGDSVTYFCIHDINESRLFKNLEVVFNNYLQQNPEKKDKAVTQLSYINQYYTLIDHNAGSDIRSGKIIFFDQSSNTLSGYLSIDIPPPEELSPLMTEIS